MQDGADDTCARPAGLSWPGGHPPIRSVRAADIAALRDVIDENELFPSAMLEGMAADFLINPNNPQIWLTCDEARPVAVAFCAPEPMTAAVWNLYLIAVHPSAQGEGRGSALLRKVQDDLMPSGARMLLVETSGLPEFERTRMFYVQNGFTVEARIRDFYDDGEDKIVFRKRLRQVPPPP